MATTKEHIGQLELRVKQLESDLVARENDLRETVRITEDELKSKDDVLEEYMAEIEAKDARIQDLENHVEKLEEKLEDRESTLRLKNVQIDQLSKRAAELAAQVRKWQDAQTDMEKSMDAIELSMRERPDPAPVHIVQSAPSQEYNGRFTPEVQQSPVTIASHVPKPPPSAHESARTTAFRDRSKKLAEAWASELLSLSYGGVGEGWKHLEHHEGVRCMERKDTDPFVVVKGFGSVPASAEETFAVLQSPETIHEWDRTCKSVRVIERIDESLSVLHLKFESNIPLVDHRDIVCMASARQVDEVTWCILYRSVLHDDAPEERGYTRARLNPSGLIVRSDGEASCIVCYVLQLDARGWIPRAGVERDLHDRMRAVARVRSLMGDIHADFA